MKTFLNVFGILALLFGVIALLAANSAIHEILGALSILLAVTAFGFSTLIDRADTHLERTSAQRLMEREHWQQVLAAVTTTKEKPVTPEAQCFYVAKGKDAVGPHDQDMLAQLLQRQVLTTRSLVCKEGSNQWQELGTVIKPATNVVHLT